jgi:hypothetical protein
MIRASRGLNRSQECRLRHPSRKNVIELANIRQDGIALRDSDLKAWMRVLSALPAGELAEAGLLAWVEGPLREFFPFEKFLGRYGSQSGGRIEMRSLVSSGHTREFLVGLESK